jgi:DNA-binding LytR/AlgR family response regulator
MTTLRVLAVDDEALALRRVELLLERIPDVELVGTARSGPEALQRLPLLKPDVMLLDVKMGQMDGFEVVENLAGRHIPQIIFVTAFDEFATRAFEVSATDYVVKPVELDRLAAALAKARSAHESSDAELRIAELRAVIAALREERLPAARRQEAEVWAQRRGAFVRIKVDAIDWIEAERDYVHLHCGPESYMLRETLTGIHERLGSDRFLRIRRSALVRADRLTSIRKAGYGDVRVRLADGRELRVGRTYVRAVRQMLRNATSEA